MKRCRRLRAGMALLEVVLVMMMITTLLGAGISLSSRNVNEHQEILERAIAEGICLDVLERLKEFKSSWTMPGSSSANPTSTTPTTTTADDEMFGAVEVGWMNARGHARQARVARYCYAP